MIADFILDRRAGVPYDAKKFYDYVRGEEDVFEFNPAISRAMAGGSEEDVKKALCRYIVDQGYNDRVCDYINSVDWLGEYVGSSRKAIKSKFNFDKIADVCDDLDFSILGYDSDPYGNMIAELDAIEGESGNIEGVEIRFTENDDGQTVIAVYKKDHKVDTMTTKLVDGEISRDDINEAIYDFLEENSQMLNSSRKAIKSGYVIFYSDGSTAWGRISRGKPIDDFISADGEGLVINPNVGAMTFGSPKEAEEWLNQHEEEWNPKWGEILEVDENGNLYDLEGDILTSARKAIKSARNMEAVAVAETLDGVERVVDRQNEILIYLDVGVDGYRAEEILDVLMDTLENDYDNYGFDGYVENHGGKYYISLVPAGGIGVSVPYRKSMMASSRKAIKSSVKSALSRDEILEQIEFYEQQIEDTENLLNGEYNDVGRNKRKLLERRLKDFKDGLARLNELLGEKSIKSAKESEQKKKETVSVDVNSLYHFLGGEAEDVESDFAVVRCTEDDGEEYYDILSDGGLACMDGETCEIVGRGEGFVELHSIEADDGVNFKLSPEEFEVACGKSKKEIKSSLTSDSFKMIIGECRKMAKDLDSKLGDWWVKSEVGQDVVYFVAEHNDYSVRVRFEFMDSGFCYVSKVYTNGSYYEPVVLESWKYEGLSAQEIESKILNVLENFFPKYNEIESSKKAVKSAAEKDYSQIVKLCEDLKAYPKNKFPPAGIYKRLIDWKEKVEGRGRDEIEEAFGNYTSGEWMKELKESL